MMRSKMSELRNLFHLDEYQFTVDRHEKYGHEDEKIQPHTPSVSTIGSLFIFP